MSLQISTTLSLAIKIMAAAMMIFLSLIFSTYSSAVNAREKLVFTSVKDAYNQQISVAVLKIAYQRLGVDFETDWLHAKRALMISSGGLSDGEISRAAVIEEEHPSLIRVKIPVNYLEAIAFTKDEHIDIQGWESLKPYILGVNRGMVFAEKATKGMNTQFVNSFPSLFNMLKIKRVDVAISPLINGLYHINKHGLKGAKINEPPLARFKLYHFLHKKHANKVAPLEAILKDMQQKKEIESIRVSFLKDLKMGKIRGEEF